MALINRLICFISFAGDYGSTLEQQLEELKNFQTLECGDARQTLCNWQHSEECVDKAMAALTAAVEWMDAFLEQAENVCHLCPALSPFNDHLLLSIIFAEVPELTAVRVSDRSDLKYM